jgi:hypothetical protein
MVKTQRRYKKHREPLQRDLKNSRQQNMEGFPHKQQRQEDPEVRFTHLEQSIATLAEIITHFIKTMAKKK